MLESAYPFYFIQKDKGDSEGLLRILLYRFKSAKSKLVYIVRVEEYEHNIYAVINTCINIMLTIYQSNKKASFGFVGANGFDEDISCTKRYRVYSRIIATYFSDEYFYHKENIDKSAYMLINNISLDENPNLVEQIDSFFIKQYDYFGNCSADVTR